ncbi:Adenosylmethionine-8-amino-7-oxononanoate aminotransferase [Candidatus Purcelliella pentastirinorum]|uniref:Adenosylmethionine-8-amino-7-oxononanoate aminotransferase n=1 Tax=Candidatus Purcelliella pentastirinorum TaxID=472834 RepID=A0A346DZW4_9ENTR|nr:aminotransferase class III-fold pyridoxal phosphate-dependent enzyme [Candidatus Purcelliella pentastirinorum]AXN02269.1 Adenosylmethionine-8-amino-7-oxononanoate aminotransferase [Candidatus Purcelliella pentastirinorum]
MNFYHPKYLYKLKLLCNKYEIFLIYNKIYTGFSRTNKFFVFEYFNIVFLCIGKVIIADIMILAVTINSSYN